MDVIVHKGTESSIYISQINPAFLSIAMGAGEQYSDEKKERIIAAWVQEPHGFPLDFATEYVNAVSAGGMTEAEVYALLARRTTIRRGLEGTWEKVAEESLPSDRYFRNAWEWSD